MSLFFAHLVKGAAGVAQAAGYHYAQRAAVERAQAQAAQNPKRAKRKEGCTPCAAKKRGAEMANWIWKGR